MDLAYGLNFKHLKYLWLVGREGSVTAAAAACGVEQSAVSVQLKRLEHHLKQKLFVKDGRRLALTSAGRVAFDYADDIFRLGRELEQAVRHGGTLEPARVAVGVTDVIPKLIAYRLLEPVYALPDPVRLVCVEDAPEKLLAALARGDVDVVLTESPVAAPAGRVYQHLLGECGVTVFAAGPLAAQARRGFPKSLDGLPVLLPTGESSLRRSLDRWFAAVGVRPDVRGEFADSALLKEFGRAGRGVFVLPSAVEGEVVRQFEVQAVGRTDEVRVRFYAYTAERKVTHPAVLAIRDAARQELFSGGRG
jgi:LysR family transcriptional activator of nhaA